MKKYLLLLFFLLLTMSLTAQTYCNEWIDYNQQYYKIKIAEDGIYRIPYATLVDLGIPLESHGYQLYHQGKQVPIYVNVTGALKAGDYIEFIGHQNDGSFDTQLYLRTDGQLSTEHSLFTDTAAYFLVWIDQAVDDQQRFEAVTNVIPEPPPTPLAYFMKQSQIIVKSAHHSGYSGQRLQRGYLNVQDTMPTILYSYGDFEYGEGYLSVLRNRFNYTLSTANYEVNAPEMPELSVTLLGYSTQDKDHEVVVRLNDLEVLQSTFENFDIARIVQTLAHDVISNAETTVEINIPTLDLSTQTFSALKSVRLTYPHRFQANGAAIWQFALRNQSQQYIEINDFDGGETAIVYDLTNEQRLAIARVGEGYPLFLPEGHAGTEERNIWLLNPMDENNIQQVEATAITPIQFVDFTHTLKQGDYIMIAPNQWITEENSTVQMYANYRNSTIGGNHTPTVVAIEQLYDQFAYGIAKHPLAIRQFINFAIDHWAISPQYLLLLGKAISYNQLGLPTSYQDCLVPTYGQRPSDNMLAFRDINAKKAQVAVGRIPAKSREELRHYFDKVVTYEQNKAELPCTKAARYWQKQVIHVSGNDSSEKLRANLLGFLDTLAQQITETQFGASVSTFAAKGDNGVFEDRFPTFTQKMKEGVGLITFWGGTQQGNWWQFPLDSAKAYNNKGKYPFMLSVSSFSGNIHQWKSATLGESVPENYVLHPEGGAIAYLGAIGHYLGYYEFVDFQYYFYDLLTNESYGQSIGQIFRQTVDRFYETTPEAIAKIPAQHMTLTGDPAIRLHLGENPEYVVEQEDVRLLHPDDQSVLTEITMALDSFDVEVVVTNLGRAVSGELQVDIGLFWNEALFVLHHKRMAAPLHQDTLLIRIPNNAGITSGFYQIAVSIDPDGQIPELCEDNNQLVQATPIFIESRCEGLAIEVAIQTDALFDAETGLFILPIGETITLTAPDLGTDYQYQWSNEDMGTTIEVGASGVYELTVTHHSGCVGGGAITVFDDQFVWAGDANNDGNVDHYDLLYMGLAYNATGAVRPTIGTVWNGLPSLDWNQAFSSETPISINFKHADSNGDGIINTKDVPTILKNYHQTHAKTELIGVAQEQDGQEGIPLFWEIADTVIAGYEHIFSVQLGDENTPANDIYGIAFTAEFRLAEGNDSIALNNPVFKTNNSWLGTVQEDLATIDTCLKNKLNWDVALTRTNQKGISGQGPICSMICVMEISSLKRSKRAARTVAVAFSNIKVITLSGDGREDIASAPLEEVAVDPQIATFTLLDQVLAVPNETAIEAAAPYSLTLFPNPNKGQLYLQIEDIEGRKTAPLELKIYDIMGKMVKTKPMPSTQAWNDIYWDVRDLNKGYYFVVASWGEEQIIEKLILE